MATRHCSASPFSSKGGPGGDRVVTTRANGLWIRRVAADNLINRLRAAAPHVHWATLDCTPSRHNATARSGGTPYVLVYGHVNDHDGDLAADLARHVDVCVAAPIESNARRNRAPHEQRPHFLLVHAPGDQLHYRCFESHDTQRSGRTSVEDPSGIWHWHPAQPDCVAMCTMTFGNARGVHVWFDDEHVHTDTTKRLHGDCHLARGLDTLCSMIRCAAEHTDRRRRTSQLRTLAAWHESRVAAVPCSLLVAHADQNRRQSNGVKWYWWPWGRIPQHVCSVSTETECSTTRADKSCATLSLLCDDLPESHTHNLERRVISLHARINAWTGASNAGDNEFSSHAHQQSNPGPQSSANIRTVLRDMLQRLPPIDDRRERTTFDTTTNAHSIQNHAIQSRRRRRRFRNGSKRRRRRPFA